VTLETDQDLLLLGDCDKMVTELCETLGWAEELKAIWDAAENTVEEVTDPHNKSSKARSEKTAEKTVETLTEQIKSALKLNEKSTGDDRPEKVSSEEQPSSDSSGRVRAVTPSKAHSTEEERDPSKI